MTIEKRIMSGKDITDEYRSNMPSHMKIEDFMVNWGLMSAQDIDKVL